MLDLSLALLGTGLICGTFPAITVGFGQVEVEVSPYRVFGF